MDAKETLRTFEDLEAYEVAREFRKEMHAAARKLPDAEKYGFTRRIQRAAVSLTNNIAEGHGRYPYLDPIRFMLQARGSLEEWMDDLNVGADAKYWPATEIEQLKPDGWRVSQLRGGYIRVVRKCKTGENLALRDISSEYLTATRNEFCGPAMQRFTIQRL